MLSGRMLQNRRHTIKNTRHAVTNAIVALEAVFLFFRLSDFPRPLYKLEILIFRYNTYSMINYTFPPQRAVELVENKKELRLAL